MECGEFVKLFLVKSAGDGLGVGLAQLQGGCVSKTGKFSSKKYIFRLFQPTNNKITFLEVC